MGDSAQLFSAMTAEISALGKVLAKQTVGIFIAGNHSVGTACLISG
jgi:hypothetical protein